MSAAPTTQSPADRTGWGMRPVNSAAIHIDSNARRRSEVEQIYSHSAELPQMELPSGAWAQEKSAAG